MKSRVENTHLFASGLSFNKEDKDSSLEYIRTSAGKVSTLVLDKKRMQDYWGGVARLPGISQVIFAPYRLISYGYDCIKNRIAPSLEVRHYKLVADLIKVANTIGIGLLYACKMGLNLSVSIALILPMIMVTGIVISVVEGGVEAYRLYQQNQFLEKFNVKTFATIDELRNKLKITSNSTDGLNLLSTLTQAIKNDSFISPERKEELYKAIENIQNQSEKDIFLDYIGLLLSRVEKTLLTDRFQELEDKYFKLSSKEIESITEKTNKNFEEQEFVFKTDSLATSMTLELGSADGVSNQLLRTQGNEDYQGSLIYDVQYGLNLIKTAFEKKQLGLAGKVQPWLAHKIATSYQNLLQGLKKSEECPENSLHAVMEAKELLTRIDFNATLKRDVNKINLGLWTFTILSSIIGFLFPSFEFVVLAFFVTSFSISAGNHIAIETYLNNEESMEKPAWGNLIPSWFRKIREKKPSEGADLARREIVDVS